jgi:hypothetical protein
MAKDSSTNGTASSSSPVAAKTIAAASTHAAAQPPKPPHQAQATPLLPGPSPHPTNVDGVRRRPRSRASAAEPAPPCGSPRVEGTHSGRGGLYRGKEPALTAVAWGSNVRNGSSQHDTSRLAPDRAGQIAGMTNHRISLGGYVRRLLWLNPRRDAERQESHQGTIAESPQAPSPPSMRAQ